MPTIKKGDNGEAVKQLQAGLKKLGYEVGEADGAFGAITAASLRCFQADHGLVIDAICGTKTWTALNDALNALEMVHVTPEEKPTENQQEEIVDVHTRQGWQEVLQQMRAVIDENIALNNRLTQMVESLNNWMGGTLK